MAIPKRHSPDERQFQSSPTFFVTTSTAARRRFFQVERHADLLLKTLYEYRDSAPFQLHEFCIMPDHVHLLLTISPGMTIEKALQLIKGGFAFRAGKEFGANGTIWQRGFSEMRIFELEGFHARKHYIRQNAVQTGLVATAEEFRFCSAFPGYSLDPVPENLRG